MGKAIKKFQIRYNTVSANESDRWRLIQDGSELLVSDIFVNGHTYTTKDWMPEIDDYKWHITCEGHCKIKNGIAYITTVKEESVLTRHILKTLSYRILGTITTVTTAYMLGASMELSSLLGVGELLLKPVIYFFHERVWYKFIRIGAKK
jgi:uncharacterized membrane protein